MALLRFYHLALLSFFFLLLAGLTAADLSGGKTVTLTIQYPPAGSPPGEKTRISTHYADGNGGRRFDFDCDDDEPLGFAMKYMVSTLEEIAGSQRSRSEL